jgi:serine/threonine protein phosphatase PrpC
MEWDDVILLSGKRFGWNMMIENVKEAYIHHRWTKFVALLGVLISAMLLSLCSGGFPPWAWRFLVQVIPQLPLLWGSQGAIILLPLLGLSLLSLSLLILWSLVIFLGGKVIIHLWRDYSAHQSFENDLRAATLLAEQALDEHNNVSAPLAPAAPANQRRQTQPIQIHIPASQPQAVRQRTTKVLTEAEAERRTAAYAPSKVVGEVHFPGLTYPTPVLRPAQRDDAHGASQQATRTASGPQYVVRNGQPGFLTLPQKDPSTRERLRIIAQTAVDEASGRAEDLSRMDGQTLVEPVSRERETPRHYDQLSFDGQILDDEEGSDYVDDDEAESDYVDEDGEEQSDLLDDEEQTDLSDDEEEPTRSSADELEIDLWETRSGDLDDDVDLDQYDLLDSQDGEIEEVGYQFSARYTSLPGDNDEFDFDQQSLPVKYSAADSNMLSLIVGIGIDPGLKRKNAPNEDSLFAIQGMRVTDEGSQPAGLFVVADGMGGHSNGREASRTAIHSISDVIVPALLRDVSGNSAKEEKALFLDMLKNGVHQANLSLYRRNRDLTPNMMGTTLTAALQVGTTAYIANVGDSRTYLYRPSEGLSQITHDHSVVARLVEDGIITPEEIYTHPKRNQIYRCLGEHASVEMDAFVITLQADDILLLCSDGLWEMVHDDALEKIIANSSHNPSQISALLVQAALNHGGVDNISVIAVSLTSPANK